MSLRRAMNGGKGKGGCGGNPRRFLSVVRASSGPGPRGPGKKFLCSIFLDSSQTPKRSTPRSTTRTRSCDSTVPFSSIPPRRPNALPPVRPVGQDPVILFHSPRFLPDAQTLYPSFDPSDKDRCSPTTALSKSKLQILTDFKALAPNLKCNFDPCLFYRGKFGPACCPAAKCQEAQAINAWLHSKAHPAFADMVEWAGAPTKGANTRNLARLNIWDACGAAEGDLYGRDRQCTADRQRNWKQAVFRDGRVIGTVHTGGYVGAARVVWFMSCRVIQDFIRESETIVLDAAISL